MFSWMRFFGVWALLLESFHHILSQELDPDSRRSVGSDGDHSTTYIGAHLSGSKMVMEELSEASSEDGLIFASLRQIKHWFFTHFQHLNFLTILILASVPNPLFDLVGIMCGQFGISFWKFFLATLIGKALIKTHIQTVFIISLFNNQLLEWLENELIRVLGLIPGSSSALPSLIAKLRKAQEMYLSNPIPDPSLPDGMALR